MHTIVRLLLLLAPVAFAPVAAAFDGDVLVGRATVIDGDTLEIRGQRIRLWGIDAPESSQVCHDGQGRPWRCGASAANELADFLDVRNVSCRSVGTRSYNRVVARCAVDGTDLGAWLVANGLALDYRHFSKGRYALEQAAAARAGAGMHAGTFVVPWEYRRPARR